MMILLSLVNSLIKTDWKIDKLIQTLNQILIKQIWNFRKKLKNIGLVHVKLLECNSPKGLLINILYFK